MPAISIADTPSIAPTAADNSPAIAFGGFFNCRASWNAAGTANLAKRRLLGLLGLRRPRDSIQRFNPRGKGLRNAFFQKMKHERTSMPAPASYNGVVPKVTFLDIGRTVEFESGKLPYQEHGKPESILDVALNFGIQLEHACGGSCACTTCHVHMKTGAEVNLSPMDEDELDRVETAGDLTLESRLGCQAIVVKGDVVVAMPAWNRNYVSEGGGSMNLGDAIPVAKK